MNRSLKVFVATVLALSLCLSFGSAFAKKENKPPKPTKPPRVVVESIALSLVNKAGATLTPDAGGTYTVVTGQKYIVKADVTPAGTKDKLRWRSTRPGVANVNSRGNVFCVRPGTATITAASKSGKVKQSIVLNVKANMASFDATADKAVKKIYLKGRSLMIDVVLVNAGAEPLRRAPELKFFLKLAGESDYAELGVKTGRLQRAIAAGATGTASYKVKTVDPRTIWLLDASAYCEAP